MTDAPPLCCGVPARLTSGAEIYPNRPDLRTKPIWKCDRCKSYCGCHPGTTKSLGVPANAATRKARSQFHDLVFDPIWETAEKTGGYANIGDPRSTSKIRKAARSRLYGYLAEKVDWRAHLTPAEADLIGRSDAAARRIGESQTAWNREFKDKRQVIVRRATKRAKQAEKSR